MGTGTGTGQPPLCGGPAGCGRGCRPAAPLRPEFAVVGNKTDIKRRPKTPPFSVFSHFFLIFFFLKIFGVTPLAEIGENASATVSAGSPPFRCR